MTQLSLFDEVIEAAPVAVSPTPNLPTFFIEYYDEDGRSKLAWMRAKDEDDAAYKYKKQNEDHSVIDAYLSERDYDELEALD